MNTGQSAYAKLRAARTRLVIERPFLGALAMHLRLEAIAAPWCHTIGTDARTLYFNPRYVEDLDFADAQFALAHVALHCALGHFARRAHRVRRRWNIACDHAVNLLLIDDGMKAPPGALADARFRGLSAEEIYPYVPADAAERLLDDHVVEAFGPTHLRSATAGLPRGALSGESAPSVHGALDSWDDAGNEEQSSAANPAAPPPLTLEENAALARSWKMRTATAAQRARLAGRLAPSWQRLLAGILQPRLPWRAVLARYLAGIARDDYSFQRLSRREGAALLPRLATAEVDVCVAVDTSGSIGETELAEFASEIDALKGQLRARVTLLACDERLDERGPWEYQAWEPLVLPSGLQGGGGTSFAPVFEWAERECYRPDVLVYFTDGHGDFPACAPDYPVVWVVKGRGEVPWGERVQLA